MAISSSLVPKFSSGSSFSSTLPLPFAFTTAGHLALGGCLTFSGFVKGFALWGLGWREVVWLGWKGVNTLMPGYCTHTICISCGCRESSAEASSWATNYFFWAESFLYYYKSKDNTHKIPFLMSWEALNKKLSEGWCGGRMTGGPSPTSKPVMLWIMQHWVIGSCY